MQENCFQPRLEQLQTFSMPNTPCTCTHFSQQLNQDPWAAIWKIISFSICYFLDSNFSKNELGHEVLLAYGPLEQVHLSFGKADAEIEILLSKVGF